MSSWDDWRRKTGLLLNSALCNVGWFANVLLAAHQHPLWGPSAQVGLGLLHVLLVCPLYELDRRGEVVIILASVLYALVVESSLGYFFNVVPWTVAPPFILALWANFAMSLNVSFGFLKSTSFPWVPAILGLVFGPVSYWSGIKLGAIEVPHDLVFFMVLIAIEWCISFPLLLWLANSQTRKVESTSTPELEA
ncbi:hypothetical protein NDN08_006461 [Rhodosorus marinus]|uniref:DUF2878 domain-containing protein n=1 Tax=Rhodosorus marinus TaxID=101924 RepID=A0AAV8UKE9_9RHOD|nr:hypothetical protein NDN08_006461 [Rhodosorus marinus]